MEHFKSRGSWLMYITVLGLYLCSLSIGMVLSWTSSALPSILASGRKLRKDVVGVDVQSWIKSAPFLTCIVGGLLAGFFSRLFGRRICTILSSFILCLGWLIVANSPNSVVLIVGRLVSGFACGIYSATVTNYVVELVPIWSRGNFGSAMACFFSFGILLTSILGTYVDWSMLAYLSALPPLIIPILLWFGVESPVYVFNKYGSEEAIILLARLRSQDSDIEAEVDLLTEGPQQSELVIPSWNHLRKRHIHLPLIYTWVCLFFQQDTGFFAVLANEKSILINHLTLNPDFCTIFLNTIGVIMRALSCLIIEKFQRKTLFFVSGIGCCLSLSSLAVCFYLQTKFEGFSAKFSPLIVGIVALYFVSYSIGWGPIPWFIGSELCPYSVKGFILATSQVISFGFAFIVTSQFENLKRLVSAGGAFLVFAVFVFFGFIFTTFVLPETKGKSPDQLQDHFTRSTGRQERNCSADISR